MSNIDDVIEIKEEIQEAEKKVHELNGSINSLFDSLKELLEIPESQKITNDALLKKAQEQIDSFSETIEKDKNRLEKIIEKIKEQKDQWT